LIRRIVGPYALLFLINVSKQDKKNFKQITNVCAKIWKRAFCQCCFAIFQDSVIKFMSLLFHFCTHDKMKKFVWIILTNPFLSQILFIFIREKKEREKLQSCFFMFPYSCELLSGLALNTHFWFYLIWNMLSGLVWFY
jgi:hypothetical protein